MKEFLPFCLTNISSRQKGGVFVVWSKEDFTIYSTAESPYYHVYNNGKVDIGFESGGDQKISLHTWGMYKLVKKWLDSGHDLNNEEKETLIMLLNKGPKSYNPEKKKWE